jgi:hypothetical protein
MSRQRFFVAKKGDTMLTEIQLYTLAVLATVIVYAVNLLVKAKVKINRGWLTVAVYVISGLLAYAWNAPAFPAFPPFVDLAAFVPALITYISALLTLLGPVVALATLIYNALLKKVLDNVAVRLLKK